MNIFDYYHKQTLRTELLSILDHGETLHPNNLPVSYLEKDLWVTELLRLLYDENLLGDMVVAFKGGTALSKWYKAIERFSEDIDLSIDLPEIAGCVDDPQATWDKSTQSKSQNKKFRESQTKRLEQWTIQFVDRLNARLKQFEIEGLYATYAEDSAGEKVEVHYPAVTTSASQYQLDYVLLEFGARNRGKPTNPGIIKSYLGEIPELNMIDFPCASQVKVFDPNYIVWEKLTALHQFSTRSKMPNPARLARHWYDVDCIVQKNIVDPLACKQAMCDVIDMKSVRWPVPGVDFTAIKSGGLVLVPKGELLQKLYEDQANMIAGNMYFGQPDDFAVIIKRLGKLEAKINSALI